MPARVHIECGDVRPEAAAKRLGLTLAEFHEVLDQLVARGFPQADPDTHMYDIDAIDEWRRARHPRIFGLTSTSEVRSESDLVAKRIAAMRKGKSK
jgi:hypothetical protein